MAVRHGGTSHKWRSRTAWGTSSDAKGPQHVHVIVKPAALHPPLLANLHAPCPALRTLNHGYTNCRGQGRSKDSPIPVRRNRLAGMIVLRVMKAVVCAPIRVAVTWLAAALLMLASALPVQAQTNSAVAPSCSGATQSVPPGGGGRQAGGSQGCSRQEKEKAFLHEEYA